MAARGGFLLALGAAAAIGFGAPILLDRIESLEARLNAAAIQIEAGRQQSRDERAADVQPLRLGLEALNARTDQSLAEQRAELVAEIGALEGGAAGHGGALPGSRRPAASDHGRVERQVG